MHVVEAEHERRVGRDPLEPVAQLAMEPMAIGRARADLASQGLGPERVGQVGLVFRGARGEHYAPLGLLDEVLEQPRLADARLSLDHQHPAGAAVQRGQRARDRLALSRATDQLG